MHYIQIIANDFNGFNNVFLLIPFNCLNFSASSVYFYDLSNHRHLTLVSK